MNQDTADQLMQLDRQHVWHPYASVTRPLPTYLVKSAQDSRLFLADGRVLIDGMASWWSVIHGYNHPLLNQAIENQLKDTAHVMFGGLTHEPAVHLAEKLVSLTPEPLQQVFFSDSGSVAVEVALKMAIQYWQVQGQPAKHKMLALRQGYHGDTLGAMSVCDPVTGMHQLFQGVLPQQYFADAPQCRFDQPWDEADIASLHQLLAKHHQEIAAVILEPIVQGAGGMRFYSPTYLQRARSLCDQFDVLLICDEIATNFGRTGKLFACEHAGIAPDIMCLGKALTGGYMSLAATLTNQRVSHGICDANPGVFMHGPTFMGNPLACATALASIDLLLSHDWQARVAHIERHLNKALAPAKAWDHIQDVRVLGAIGVIEAKQPARMQEITAAFVEAGIWVRPFGKLCYIMPPFTISDEQLSLLTGGLVQVVQDAALFAAAT